MSWYFWVLFSVITTAIANLLQRILMREKESDPLASAILFQFVTGIITGIFAFWKGFVPFPIGQYFWNFLLSSFLWGFGTFFLFRALQTLGASEVAILSSLGAVVTIVSSIFFLGESFNVQKTIGTILIVSAIFLVNMKKGGFVFGKGTWYAVITAMFYGLAVTNDAYILKTYDAVSYTALISFFPGILLLALKPRAIYAFKQLKNLRFFKNMLLLSLFYSAQAIAYYVALEVGVAASQLAIIYKSNIILTVILATIFLREKERIIGKLFAAFLVTAGVLMIK